MVRRMISAVCLGIVGLGLTLCIGDAEAVVTGPINVRALPSGSCSVNASGAGTFADVNSNGISDDSDAFACAVAYASTNGGGEIYVPAGHYYLNRTISVTNTPIAFRGEGQRISVLEFYNPAGHGIDFTSTSTTVNKPLSVRSLSIMRMSGETGHGINAAWPAATNYGDYGVVTTTIHDVHVSTHEWPANIGHDDWLRGIVLVNATGATVTTFNVLMSSIHDTGIYIGGASRDVTIGDGDIAEVTNGVQVMDTSENVHIRNVEVGATVTGYWFQGGRGHTLSDCHVLARDIGIKIYSHQVAVSNCLVFGGPIEGSGFWGIELATDNARITGNAISMINLLGSNTIGIVVHGLSKDSVLLGNTIGDQHVGVYINSATQGHLVAGNILRPRSGGTPTVDLGTNNLLINNH